MKRSKKTSTLCSKDFELQDYLIVFYRRKKKIAHYYPRASGLLFAFACLSEYLYALITIVCDVTKVGRISNMNNQHWTHKSLD